VVRTDWLLRGLIYVREIFCTVESGDASSWSYFQDSATLKTDSWCAKGFRLSTYSNEILICLVSGDLVELFIVSWRQSAAMMQVVIMPQSTSKHKLVAFR
jgi:hypothetical protein